MSITSKIRLFRGLRANLPVPPTSFELGRPYFCTDTGELFIGAGVNAPMAPVSGTGGVAFAAEVAARIAGDASTLSSAESYTDGLAPNYDPAGAADAALVSADAYTDSSVAAEANTRYNDDQNLITYVNAQDANTLTAAETYADNHVPDVSGPITDALATAEEMKPRIPKHARVTNHAQEIVSSSTRVWTAQKAPASQRLVFPRRKQAWC